MRVFNHEIIKNRRLKLRLTQQELAKIAGTSRGYLIEIEKGRKIPKAPMIAKIAYALKVRESYFFVKEVNHEATREHQKSLCRL